MVASARSAIEAFLNAFTLHSTSFYVIHEILTVISSLHVHGVLRNTDAMVPTPSAVTRQRW